MSNTLELRFTESESSSESGSETVLCVPCRLVRADAQADAVRALRSLFQHLYGVNSLREWQEALEYFGQ